MVGGVSRDGLAHGVLGALLCEDGSEGGDEASVDPRQRALGRGRDREGRVRRVCVFDRQLDEQPHDIVREALVLRPLRPKEQEDDALSMRDREGQQVLRRASVRVGVVQTEDVGLRAQRLDLRSNPARELRREPSRDEVLEQLVLVGKVFVEVADGRAGALDDVAERGSFEPTLGERLCGEVFEARFMAQLSLTGC